MNNMIQLIGEDGRFNASELYNFSKIINLDTCGASYTVVSIIGAQSSGKSTLLNHLFGTNFTVMDAERGRTQTTKGVWLAKAVDIEPCTLVIDVEGSDGSEREDDTLFERQSAVFAHAISDIIIFNMYCKDVGRINGGSLHLLRTIFKKVTSLENQRKKTLLFVLRDKLKTPLETLEDDIWRSIEKIYEDSVLTAEDKMESSLSLYFIIQVIPFPHYELQEQEFMDEVATLRKKFNNPTTGDLDGHQPDKARASDFPISTENIWKNIQDNEDLVIPTDKVMVSTVRCDEISNEVFASFAQNKDWLQLVEGLKTGRIESFGKMTSTIFVSYLSEYATKAFNFDEGVKTSKRQILLDRMVEHVRPAYESLLEHLYSKAIKEFEDAFESDLLNGKSFPIAVEDCKAHSMSVLSKQCEEAEIELVGWDSSELLGRLEGAIGSYATFVDARLALARSVESLELAEAEAAATEEISTRATAEAETAERDLAAVRAAFSKMVTDSKEAAEAQIAISQAIATLALANTKASQAKQDALAALSAVVEVAADKSKKEDKFARVLQVITAGVIIVAEIFQAFTGFKNFFLQ